MNKLPAPDCLSSEYVLPKPLCYSVDRDLSSAFDSAWHPAFEQLSPDFQNLKEGFIRYSQILEFEKYQS